MKIAIFLILTINLFAFEEYFSKSKNYIEPTFKELEESKKIFKIFFENQTIKSNDYITINKNNSFYIFNTNSNSNLTLQIPHGFSDLYTKNIAFRLFNEGDFFALSINRVHRKTADLAHIKKTHFNSFNEAFTKTKKDDFLIQLHGFDNKKRKTKEAQNSDIILSNTTKKPSKKLIELNECFKEFAKSKVFPYEVSELGALTNENAKVLKNFKHNGFIHIELNKKTRDKLSRNTKFIKKFLKCLKQVYLIGGKK